MQTAILHCVFKLVPREVFGAPSRVEGAAAEVNGESPDREAILADFEAGRYQALCNAMLLTEGWDCPSVDCIVVLRPTKVRSLYTQMIGRGTRLAPGKKDLLILDFLYLTTKHDLFTTASLFSGTPEVEEKMEQLLRSGGEWDVSDAEEQAERNIMAERAASLAHTLERSSRKKARTVDPMEFADRQTDPPAECGIKHAEANPLPAAVRV